MNAHPHAPHSAAPTCTFDRDAIRAHVEMIHGLAAGIDGEIVVCIYGEDPKRLNGATGKLGVTVHKQVQRFKPGNVEGTVAGIMAFDGVPHANVYMPLHLVRKELPRGKRGEAGAIVASLGLVADMDADTGNAGSFDLTPSLVIESSPGNFQPFILFAEPISAAVAAPLAAALKSATGSDSGTGDIAHVWRVPGTANWPSATKLARGRPANPVPVTVSKPWDGTLLSIDEVRGALKDHARREGPRSGSESSSGGSTDAVAILARLKPKTRYDLKSTPPAAEDRSPHCMRAIFAMIHSGLTDDEIHIVTAAFPQGLFGRYHADGKNLATEIKRARAKIDTQPASTGDNVQLVTEDEAALRFADTFVGKLRYCHSHGAWFEWAKSHWKRNETHLAFHWARELVRDLVREENTKTKITGGKAAFAASVQRFAQADPRLAVTAEKWDQDPFLLGTPGGTVDLRTGVLRPASPADGITKVAAVTPEPAGCLLWLSFLDQTTGSDVEMIRFLQQWCGYALTGDTREHALAFVFGDGGNGKSVFVNVITGILAAYATTAAMDTFIASHGDKHSTDLAMLRGARLVTASETEEGRQWAESRIKQMTGGDLITARFMRQDNFTFRPSFKLTIIGNHKPGLKSVDDASRRRFNLIPFTRKPAVPDRQLEGKLRAEWPGILRWMIEGCLDWQSNGLVRPASVKAATDTYFDDQDMMSEWLAEKCIVDKGNSNRTETTQDLFTSWSLFAKANNEVAGTVRSFSQTLQKLGFSPLKNVDTFGGARCRGFAGITLRYDQTQQRDAD